MPLFIVFKQSGIKRYPFVKMLSINVAVFNVKICGFNYQWNHIPIRQCYYRNYSFLTFLEI